jgi:hypothetical protein
MGIILITAYRLNPTQEKEVLDESGANFLLYKPLPKILEFQAMVKQFI